jgi:2-phosphosulfolactate phosphatase
MKRTFRIDHALPKAALCRKGAAIVAVDVIRATTTAITAAAMGFDCYPAGSLAEACALASRFADPLLAGEINGVKPAGFHLNNSPAELASGKWKSGPLILLSSSGTRLIANARGCDALYLSSFRNASATARDLIREGHARVALIGAATRGEFREEDQIGCAWIGARLIRAGYIPENRRTAGIVSRWAPASAHGCLASRSVDYLRRTNQLADLEFILDHVDDLDQAFLITDDGKVGIRAPGLKPNQGLESVGIGSNPR